MYLGWRSLWAEASTSEPAGRLRWLEDCNGRFPPAHTWSNKAENLMPASKITAKVAHDICRRNMLLQPVWHPSLQFQAQQAHPLTSRPLSPGRERLMSTSWWRWDPRKRIIWSTWSRWFEREEPVLCTSQWWSSPASRLARASPHSPAFTSSEWHW